MRKSRVSMTLRHTGADRVTFFQSLTFLPRKCVRIKSEKKNQYHSSQRAGMPCPSTNDENPSEPHPSSRLRNDDIISERVQLQLLFRRAMND